MIPSDLLILVYRVRAFLILVLPGHLYTSSVFLLFLVEELEVFSDSLTSDVGVREE